MALKETDMPHPTGKATSVPDRAEALALLERLRAADGPSRDLDIAIHALLKVTRPFHRPYTESLDEALDLAEIAIPGWSVDIQCNRVPHPRDLEDHKGHPPFLYASTSAPADTGHTTTFYPAIPPEAGATRALSVCCAILASLASRYAGHGRPREDVA